MWKIMKEQSKRWRNRKDPRMIYLGGRWGWFLLLLGRVTDVCVIILYYLFYDQYSTKYV